MQATKSDGKANKKQLPMKQDEYKMRQREKWPLPMLNSILCH